MIRHSSSVAPRRKVRAQKATSPPMMISMPQVSDVPARYGTEEIPNYLVIARNSWASCQFLRRMSASFRALSGSRLVLALCAFLIFFFSHSGLSGISLSQFVSSSLLVSPVEQGAHHGFGRLVACPPYPPQHKRGEKRSCTISRDHDACLRLGGLQRAPSIISSLRVTPVKFTDYSDSRLSLHIMGLAT